ncbi:hypothetical protein [Kitasatospora mediocidica]|uniref:hypothetical protein n=1 Tax=Kitasatospora mediocidica TaxID=58352 RepID=UPI000AB24DBC|nr:hypothetical protein [Kitasatospora mediocidica]
MNRPSREARTSLIAIAVSVLAAVLVLRYTHRSQDRDEFHHIYQCCRTLMKALRTGG